MLAIDFALGQRVRIVNVAALRTLCFSSTTGTVIDVNPVFLMPIGVELDGEGVVNFYPDELELLPNPERE